MDIKNCSIIYGYTEQRYHNIPDELSDITLSPDREAVFQYISQIDPDRFHEFVLDILVQVEGHKAVDITNGPGDEKQDIITITPQGQRHLTQCKHTINYKTSYSGDELDLMFSACFRKNCQIGLMVTNADLSPQAKRYVTDEEYLRGNIGSHQELPKIDYWNGSRIWDKICTNTSILNKWFSGMSQAHGLRMFNFDMVFHQMPNGSNSAIKYKDIYRILENKKNIVKPSDGRYLECKLNDEITFNISNSIDTDLNLGVPYIPPNNSFVNVSLYAVRINVTVSEIVGQYDPYKYCNTVVKFIGDEVLPDLNDNEWWHIISTMPQTFIFLQDIKKPRLVSIGEAESYIKTSKEHTVIEKEWVLLNNDTYKRVDSDDNTLNWIHLPSGVEIELFFEQRQHPIAAYEQFMSQQMLMSKLHKYTFFAIPNLSQENIHFVRRIISPKCVGILVEPGDTLLIAYPPDEDENVIKKFKSAILKAGLNSLMVLDEDKAKIIESTKLTQYHIDKIITSEESKLSTPVDIQNRIVQLSKVIQINKGWKRKYQFLHKLLEFKIIYENNNGFDYLNGKQEAKFMGEEIFALLFDIFTVRGRRMLDISFRETEMHVDLRIREKCIISTQELVEKCFPEMNEIISKLTEIAEENT